MPETGEQPAKPVRTWRPMILWSAGIVLAMVLVWFVAAVVVPVWQVHAAVMDTQASSGQNITPMSGEPRQNAAKIRMYIRVTRPDGSREKAAYMLYIACAASSGSRGDFGALLDGLADANPDIRLVSVDLLGKLRSCVGSDGVAMALQAATLEKDERVRTAAAEALKKIRGEEPAK